MADSTLTRDADGPVAQLIRRPPTLAAQAYSGIKALIVSGGMPPGSAHTEAALARELGISRAPLREALRTLEEEGFVDSGLPAQGFLVTPITRRDVANLYEVRTALEGVAAFDAARHIPEESIAAMAVTLDDIEAGLQKGDTTLYLQQEFPFHDLWVRNSANPLLIRHIDRLRDHVLRVVNHLDLPLEHTIASFHEHREIFAAIQSGQGPEAVRAAVERHAHNVSQRIDACMAASAR